MNSQFSKDPYSTKNLIRCIFVAQFIQRPFVQTVLGTIMLVSQKLCGAFGNSSYDHRHICTYRKALGLLYTVVRFKLPNLYLMSSTLIQPSPSYNMHMYILLNNFQSPSEDKVNKFRSVKAYPGHSFHLCTRGL